MARLDRRGEGGRREPVLGLALHGGRTAVVERDALVRERRSGREVDGLEYAYLAGGEGPQIETKAGWDVDSVEIRVILDFGAGFIDWRGW